MEPGTSLAQTLKPDTLATFYLDTRRYTNVLTVLVEAAQMRA